jgi:hypothetical protein
MLPDMDFNNSAAIADSSDGGQQFAADIVKNCGTLGEEDIHAIQSCGFWVEGVAMTALGCLALATNFVSIYGFTR